MLTKATCERKGLFGFQSQATVHHCGEIMEQKVGQLLRLHTQSRAERSKSAHACLHWVCFLQPRNPLHKECGSHSDQVFSPQFQQGDTLPSLTQPKDQLNLDNPSLRPPSWWYDIVSSWQSQLIIIPTQTSFSCNMKILVKLEIKDWACRIPWLT